MNSWRRYNIFISSTFKDMDFERDVIKFRVIPELNRRFRDRRIELQAIDLRLGVNTASMSEAESERKVLSVCTSCIDSARPFFIGLIGQRYGWIPPLERWKEFMAGLAPEERNILKNTTGCSVTEMEIVYGALSEESFDSSHVLFFLRDDASYIGIPDNILPTYCDSDPQTLSRLDALKKKVRELFSERAEEDDRCTPYHLDWKDRSFSSDEFEALVTDQLARQIEIETAREDEDGTATWWAGEKELEESTLLRLLPVSVELDIYDDTDGEDDADAEESSDMAVWYCHGLGASTRMAQEYTQWDGDEDVVRLLAVFGLSEYSTSMRPVLVRWIHELHCISDGNDDLPQDELMLGKMPETELYQLLEKLIKDIAKNKYIYIYLDDVEALQISSSKDLYMPWLDRIKDQVNVMINLLDESEARAKFLEAHPYLSRKMVLGVQTDTTAQAELLISNYEKIYCLELPQNVRQQMLEAISESSDRVITPIQVHSLFRIFESLTQEDFREIRSREGSQIDAINSYLENIWSKMPDDPYDIMTDIVNTIVGNLSVGKGLRFALWTIAAAPGGLREIDIAHFAGNDWDEVQFHRAMNFLQDFFYEDRRRHLWRSKYITRPEDGLADRQRQISEYILTLDSGDSLRETMGLYYALGGGETSHFAPYMVDGDYVVGRKMGYIIRFYGPQIRQLLREGFLDSDGFEKYCLALPSTQRLQLMMDVLTALGDLPDERNRIHQSMASWLEDVLYQGLPSPDAFALASILAGASSSVPTLEKALKAARYCKEQGYYNADRLCSSISSFLIIQYQKQGENKKAEELQREAVSVRKSASERLTALNTLVARAAMPSILGGKKKNEEALDRFFEEYHSIVDSLEVSDGNMRVRYDSSIIMMNALGVLMNGKRYDRLLAEAVRFIPTMKILYLVPNFFTQAATLNTFLLHHMMMTKAADALGEPYCLVSAMSYVAMSEGGRLLNEIDPDNKLLKGIRGQLADIDSRSLREKLGMMDVKLKDIDSLIEEEYALIKK